MTREDIKKALEICADINLNCNDCPYNAVRNCNNILSADSLKLIIEQEKEIERLNDDYAKLQEQFAQYQMASNKEIISQVKQAKIDVLNELKTHSYYDDDYMDSYIFVSDIDELIEEIKK